MFIVLNIHIITMFNLFIVDYNLINNLISINNYSTCVYFEIINKVQK